MGESTARDEYYKHDADRDERAIHESVDQIQSPLGAQNPLLFPESEETLERHENRGDQQKLPNVK